MWAIPRMVAGVLSDQEMNTNVRNQRRQAKGEIERHRTQDDRKIPNERTPRNPNVLIHWKRVSSDVNILKKQFTSMPIQGVLCCL